MKKLLALITCTLLATGCTDNPKVRYDYVMPPELQGCKMFELNNGNISPVKVVVCPKLDCNTSSYQSGKTTTTSAVCY